MPTKYQVLAHTIEASKIVAVQPLSLGGKVVAPDEGLLLILDNDTKRRWVAEKDGTVPIVGDYFVRDARLNVVYTASAEKFAEMFAAA